MAMVLAAPSVATTPQPLLLLIALPASQTQKGPASKSIWTRAAQRVKSENHQHQNPLGVCVTCADTQAHPRTSDCDSQDGAWE